MDLIAEAITEYYGDRCPTDVPGCFCCDAWAQYDRWQDAEKDLADLAARYDALLQLFNAKLAEQSYVPD